LRKALGLIGDTNVLTINFRAKVEITFGQAVALAQAALVLIHYLS